MPDFDPRIAVDHDLKNRPGVPMERTPTLAPGAHEDIPRQKSRVKVFRHGRPKTMPPVYGTAQPPKGLSGLIRAFAYRYPDHLVRHWTTLIFADRVNFLEARLRKLLPLGLLAVAGFVSFQRLRRLAA